MRRLVFLAVILVCAFGLTVPLFGAAPLLSVEHVLLAEESSTCVGHAGAALQSAGFQNTNLRETAVSGETTFLRGSITCVPSGGQSIAMIAVSGPADSGNATRMMTARLRNSLRDAVAGTPAAAPARVPVMPSTISYNIDLPGKDLRSMKVSGTDPKACLQECVNDSKCMAWTWVKPPRGAQKSHCWLKFGVPKNVPKTCCVSGVMKNR